MNDDEVLYRIVNLATNEETNSSRDFTGKGRAYYVNGDIYEGYYRNGLRHGAGTYYYKKGHKYEGQWKENQKSGVGKMTFKKKGIYFGR
jgi:radial spoke head protein 1